MLLVAAWLSLGPQKQRWRRWASLWSPDCTWRYMAYIAMTWADWYPVIPHIPTSYPYESLTESICFLKSTENCMGLSPNGSQRGQHNQWESMELFQSRCKDSEGQRGCLHFSYSEVGARILKPEHGGLQMFSGVTSVKPLPELHLNKWKDTYGSIWKHMEI